MPWLLQPCVLQCRCFHSTVKFLGDDQREKESWSRLVNIVPEALVVTDISKLLPSSKREITASVLTVSQDFSHVGSFVFFFFCRTLSRVNKSGGNFAPRRENDAKFVLKRNSFIFFFLLCETKRKGRQRRYQRLQLGFRSVSVGNELLRRPRLYT